MRILPLLLLSACGLSAADTLSQHDRDFAMSHMHATRKLFLDAVAGLTPEQWNFKPAPDRWSVAECAEHIAVSEDFIAGIAKQLLKTPATPEKHSLVEGKDELLVKMVPERVQKFKAPEPIQPTHRFANPSEAVEHFKQSRERNIAYIETTQDDLRDHFMPHPAPAIGLLDGYQWFLLMSAHTERHTAQINEVKSDPKFPK
ncbi:MAG: DinB family protein [Acidobacteriota bacterium]|nr:DinB family protein [Acidobacteriota bacterium]